MSRVERAGSTDKHRVLVVDDNEDSAEMLAMVVEQLGHETRTALDGPAALKLCAEWRPELVFLDIGLPGMDGYEVARVIQAKSREEDREQPLLIALTGYGDDSDRRRTHAAGFEQHLVKPPQLEAIEAVLDGLGRAPH